MDPDKLSTVEHLLQSGGNILRKQKMLDIYKISARKSSNLVPDPTYLRTFRKELFCVETLWIVIVLLFPFLLLQVVVMSKSDICLMDESDKS